MYTTGFPVAKVLNAAGYYSEPTAKNVAVALTKARINENISSPSYLTQILDDVYNDRDPRAYPLSSYSYMVVPTALESNFNTQKGKTLGAFAYYFLCQGQQHVDNLGYSPLPINLVQAGLKQVRRIPGVDVEKINIKDCHNPTFSGDGSNTLAKSAPYPSACDKKGAAQCSTGTGGAKTPTTVNGNGSGSSGGSSGSAQGATGGGGTGPGGSASGAGGKGTAGSSAGDRNRRWHVRLPRGHDRPGHRAGRRGQRRGGRMAAAVTRSPSPSRRPRASAAACGPLSWWWRAYC